jgi:hypothetical protein
MNGYSCVVGLFAAGQFAAQIAFIVKNSHAWDGFLPISKTTALCA